MVVEAHVTTQSQSAKYYPLFNNTAAPSSQALSFLIAVRAHLSGCFVWLLHCFSVLGGQVDLCTGYSGPAVLDLSHHVVRALGVPEAARPQLIVNWTDENWDAWEERLSSPSSARHKVHSVVKRHVPARLAAALCLEADVGSDLNCANLAKSQKHALLKALTQFALPYSGHQGYAIVRRSCECVRAHAHALK